MYDYGYCYYFLANDCHLMFVGFFYNKLIFVILYRVVGTCDDCESFFVANVEGDSFVGVVKPM